MKFWGSYNSTKKRYSWSGKCIPKYGIWNYNGTILDVIDNKLCVLYSHIMDKRNIYLPSLFQKQEKIILQYWNFDKLKNKIEEKFNKFGFIILKKNKSNIYDKMLIGKRIDFDFFIKMIKQRLVYFDSGMYETNKRNYSQFRASYKLWDKLIIQEYF
jgi:hypothetical protein